MRDVIEMAREAGAVFPADGSYHKFEFEGSLERFAELVRADEREAYAHLAEKLTWADNKGVASAIRAQQALDKMAENARELGLDYEPVPENFMDALKFDVAMRDAMVANLVREGIGKHRARELADHFVSLTNAQPTLPNAIGPNEDELPAYAAGWNDCRQLMLEMRKP